MSARARLKKYLEDKRLKNVHDEVKAAFKQHGLIAHNWDHIYRDTINAIWIGEAEGAVMEIVIPAILLHDIGFLYNSDPAVHNIIGAEKCVDWLDGWSPIEKKSVSDCIRCHKGKTAGFNTAPESLEAKVVYDADLLEKIGKIGVLQGLRSFVEFGLAGVTDHQDYTNLYAIVKRRAGFENAIFYTKAGQEIASRRGGLEFRREFFNSVLAELEEYVDE
jgi:uncharacterized protein